MPQLTNLYPICHGVLLVTLKMSWNSYDNFYYRHCVSCAKLRHISAYFRSQLVKLAVANVIIRTLGHLQSYHKTLWHLKSKHWKHCMFDCIDKCICHYIALDHLKGQIFCQIWAFATFFFKTVCFISYLNRNSSIGPSLAPRLRMRGGHFGFYF
jgi:hypothetical protein